MKSAMVTGLAVGTAAPGLSALATAGAAAAPGCSSGHICLYNASGSGHAHFNRDSDFAHDLCVNPGGQILGSAPAGVGSLLLRTRTSIPCY